MFESIKKRKELIDREVSLYKEERYHQVNQEIDTYKMVRQSEVVELEKTCHKQLATYEHSFHYAKEVKGVEIAKLEAKKEMLDDYIKQKEEIIKMKDGEISRLDKIIMKSLENPSQIINKSLV
jgi:hypothetical protein